MKKLLTIVVIAFSFTGCLKGGGETTCNYNECGIVAPASEIQSVQDYLTTNGISATQHCSGLFYAIDQAGTGKKPSVCRYISINYKGKLTNGTVFDQNTSGPYVEVLDNLIAGFKNGIPLIKSGGGKIRLYIPPSLGYGSRSSATIPANSILIFEVELVDAE